MASYEYKVIEKEKGKDNSPLDGTMLKSLCLLAWPLGWIESLFSEPLMLEPIGGLNAIGEKSKTKPSTNASNIESSWEDELWPAIKDTVDIKEIKQKVNKSKIRQPKRKTKKT